MDLEGWCHFVRNVSNEEVIVISRPQTEPLYYVVEAFLFALLAYGLIVLLSWRRRRSGGRRYFQNRISMVVYMSLLVTLVAMAGFSVWFVYKRNNSDMNSIMTSRINTLQGMLQEHLRPVETPEQLSTTQTLASVAGVGHTAGHVGPGLVPFYLCQAAGAFAQILHHSVVGFYQRGDFVVSVVNQGLQVIHVAYRHLAAQGGQGPEHPGNHGEDNKAGNQ